MRPDSAMRVFTHDGHSTDTPTFDWAIASSLKRVSDNATTPYFETLYGPM